jgi:hypothetical protein
VELVGVGGQASRQWHPVRCHLRRAHQHQKWARSRGVRERGDFRSVPQLAPINTRSHCGGSPSSQVLSAAQSLSRDSNRLKLEVGKFLNSVRGT